MSVRKMTRWPWLVSLMKMLGPYKFSPKMRELERGYVQYCSREPNYMYVLYILIIS